MVLTNSDKVRNTIKIQDEDVLTYKEIEQAIADAANRISVSDEIAERYFACFILAESVSWDKVRSIGEVRFDAPKPEYFERLYQQRLSELGRGKAKKVNWTKTDTKEY